MTLRHGRGRRIGGAALPSAALMLLVSIVTSPVARATGDPGWVLTQKSVQFGDQYLYVTQSGMKVYNPRAGFAFVTHAPDWTCTLYNEKTRCFFQTTVDGWKAEMQARGMSTDARSKNWIPGAKTTIAGLSASSFKMQGNTLHGGRTKGAFYSSADYWVADNIKVPTELSALMSTMYGVPPTQCIPLRLTAVERGSARTMLDTYRMQQTSIPISYFVPPPGLTPVKSEAEVMMNGEQKQILNDMVRDLDDPSTRAPAPASSSPYIASPTQSGAGGPAGQTINVGGLNLDKAKVQKIFDALKNANSQPQH